MRFGPGRRSGLDGDGDGTSLAYMEPVWRYVRNSQKLQRPYSQHRTTSLSV